jgi:phosphatidylinositol-3-phosphatase
VQIIAPVPTENIVLSTVHVVAKANESIPISQLQVWDNGVELGWYAGASMNQYFAPGAGTHTLTVLDLDDSDTVIHETSVRYTVQSATDRVQILSPTPSQSIGSSTVHIEAKATEAVPISQMQVWDNGVKLGWRAGSSVSQDFTLVPGRHTVTVVDLDSNFHVIHSAGVSYTLQQPASH